MGVHYGYRPQGNLEYFKSGQQAYTTPGTYSWVVPDGVNFISAICVGGGGGGAGDSGGAAGSGGGGGGLVYSNNWSVTPGETLTVTVGTGGTGGTGGGSGTAGNISSIYRGGTLLVAAYGGGAGLNPGSASGGTGTYTVGTGTVIQGGSKGTGESQSGQPCGTSPRAGINGFFGDPGGGGTAIVGGSTGAAGDNASSNRGGNGGAYGGGGGTGNGAGGGNGASGAVRIIWGTNRAFPLTNTGDI